MKISKNRYLQVFCFVVVVLGIIRAAVPRLGMSVDERRVADSIQWVADSVKWVADSIQHREDSVQAVRDSLENAFRLKVEAEQAAQEEREKAAREAAEKREKEAGKLRKEAEKHGKTAAGGQEANTAVAEFAKPSRFFNADGTPARHRIVSVRSYSEAFPDAQDVQIVAANKWGVSPVMNRAEAEGRKSELVYVGSNPYYFIEPLYWSIPYLVPRAAVLLQDIGSNFLDSLQVKGLPACKIIITSVMRTKEEVERMRRYNGNATENSCHMYGTTVDIAYNRFLRVEENDQPYSKQNTVADVRLKQVLSEVLDDLRRQGRCWVKYEVKQGCFHLTVR